MTLRLRTIVPAAVLTLALAAAGCGSSSKKDTASFKTDYPAQSTKLKAIGADVGTSIQGADKMTNVQVATTFGMLAKRTHASADALKALSPPDDAKAALTKLQSSVEKVADDLDGITKAAKLPDAAGAKAAAQSLIIDSAPVKVARKKLDTLVKG